MQSTLGSEEVQVEQVHTAASVCVQQTVVQEEQVLFRDEFGTFYFAYRKTAYSVFEVKPSASQGQIKRQWKKKIARKGIASGGNQVRSKEMAQIAWGILKDPSTRQKYDEFVTSFPEFSKFKEKYPNTRSWTDRNAEKEAPQSLESPSDREMEPVKQEPVPEEAIPEDEEDEENNTNETPQLTALEFRKQTLLGLGFDDVQENEVEDLWQKVEKMSDRAGWSFFGFWYAWVPVTDTMHPLGFLLFFMSGDLGQAVAVSLVIAIMSFVPLVIIPIVETVFILLLVMYVYWKQVYDNSETFDPFYVTRARIIYWGCIRCPAGFALVVAALAKGVSGQEFAIFYFVAFRFFLAIS